MDVSLDLADIQGNILAAYGKMGFPKGRVILLNVSDAQAGRNLVETLRRRVTSALPWPSSKRAPMPGQVMAVRPAVTVNLAFTFRGLLALEVPIRTLRGMPDEFIDGMAARADILCDNFPRRIVDSWDPVWLDGKKPDRRVHIAVTLNAAMDPATGEPVPELEQLCQEIVGMCGLGGVSILEGHRGADARWQEMSARLGRQPDGRFAPLPAEHFGFVDAIGDPVFEGQMAPSDCRERSKGQGKLQPDGTWAPLATGEFLLGWPDESQEIAGAAMPLDFSRNGTFMAVRKLHQNVSAWRRCIAAQAERYAAVMDVPREQAGEILAAKIAGRWRDGVPLIAAPTFEAWQAFRDRRDAAEKAGDVATLDALRRALVDFTFGKDSVGAACPFGAHIRRANTRDMLDPLLSTGDADRLTGSVLNNRRRILRRGLPYGEAPEQGDDSDEHGIVLMVKCASLFRQFEFVQQQWMQYGLDFNAGNDTCPIVGNHFEENKFVIPADPASGKPPFFVANMPQFVETRGGEYFFVPSLTALRMIGQGLVDPT
ncbi:Dyp-type peroxidase [Falsiroseomonas sp. HW251]|uniref:Dyp-type peroxidase n=1 Tax=Falsiroseomonas sp. HW251 TaxID=3390998 RepID=UPI003D314ED3